MCWARQIYKTAISHLLDERVRCKQTSGSFQTSGKCGLPRRSWVYFANRLHEIWYSISVGWIVHFWHEKRNWFTPCFVHDTECIGVFTAEIMPDMSDLACSNCDSESEIRVFSPVSTVTEWGYISGPELIRNMYRKFKSGTQDSNQNVCFVKTY